MDARGRTVVVTGIGVVAPTGVGRDAFWAAIRDARPAVGPLTRFDATAFPSRVAGQVPDAVTNPGANGQRWITTLLFSIAVLQLTRKVPNLMPGYPSGGVDPMGVVRAIATRQFGMAFFGATSSGRRR